MSEAAFFTESRPLTFDFFTFSFNFYVGSGSKSGSGIGTGTRNVMHSGSRQKVTE
jgi:hypothetical protein